ncbi:MAG: 2-hydroxyacyl-CoA dehydratase [Syntrophobacterales bacterium]|nr:MAG: 2-hydroxyacyl-CoA dehydratase [Syntrophobacterales bacterium]
MGGVSRRSRGAEFIRKVATFSRIEGLLKDPIGILKNAHKPIMGWLCCYTPLEIILAAGIAPHRIIPEATSDMADSYLHSNFCPYIRSSLGKATKGDLDFMEGLVLVNSCDGLRRLYDAWRLYAKTPHVYLVDLPRVSTDVAVGHFRETLIRFKGQLEEGFGVSIFEGDIEEAISLSNRGRRLFKELYNLRKAHKLSISGSQVLDLVKGDMVLPKDHYLGLLQKLVGELRDGAVPRTNLPRVMITGSLLEDPGIADLVEKAGGEVACDDLCTGSRYFWECIEQDDDPILALSRHYLSKIPCARMMDSNRRLDHVMDLVVDFEVHGVICYTLKFCDTFLYDIPLLKKRLDDQGIPSLFLDSDYTPGTMGRLKTRIEAFLEMLREHV